MKNILRNIYIWLGAIFWSRRHSLAGVILSWFSLQACSCTYGTPDDVSENTGGPDVSVECKPLFNYQGTADSLYSECERNIVDKLAQAESVKAQYGENSEEFIQQWNASLDQSREIAATCDMEHLKADKTLSAYACNDGRTISTEEYEQSLK
jgi:hypothetical protein